MNNIVEEREFSNDILFSKNMWITSTLKSDLAVNFIKQIISKNNIEDESTLKGMIEYVENAIKGTER